MKKHIYKVAIGVYVYEIKSSYEWPSQHGHDGSVFADPISRDGWPAIWHVCEELGIDGSCGNGGQHEITKEANELLIHGYYEYFDNSWFLKV